MPGSLPMAVGIALSPFPVVPAILLLFTPRARATAAAFLGGWVLGVGAVVSVAVLLADLVEGFETTPTWVSWVRLLVGAALVAYGVRTWLGRGGDPGQPAWMRSLTDATPGSALRLGLLLSAANPKILLLAAAGGLAIGGEGTSVAAEVVAVLVFTAVASVTVALPLVLHLVAGERVLVPLGRAKDWLERNNDAVMAVVITVIGLYLLLSGFRGL